MRRSGLGRADPGYSSAGRTYNGIDEVWGVAQPGQGRKPDAQWYSKSRDYWETTDLTVNGVLGGYESISDVDIGSSRDLIRSLPGLQHSSAIDCGAGIGRVTEHLLLPLFDRVDMIEQSAAHVEEARRRLASHPHMRHFVVDGLQSASPPASDYDLVWIQWVVGYLTDDDLVAFFDRCASALRDTDAAYIVVKENVAKGEFFLDADDNNVTRTMGQFRAIFRRTRDLVLVKTIEQRNFPKELHGVYSFVLKRRTRTSPT